MLLDNSSSLGEAVLHESMISKMVIPCMPDEFEPGGEVSMGDLFVFDEGH